MNVRISTLAAVLAVVPLAGCEGMRDALTAHTGTVARAGNQELTAARLGELVGSSQAPVERQVVRAVADIWVDYQLLGLAAARGDSLTEPSTVDSAMWAGIASNKVRQLYERISADWSSVDTAEAPAMYQRGDLLAASHILLLTRDASDSAARAKLAQIRGIRARATGANFAQLATQYSEDQGSAARGGSLGVFPRGMMVPEFEQALRALEPGQISDVVETQFGFHVIRRPMFNEIRSELLEQARERSVQKAESTFTARLDSISRLAIRKDGAAKARAAGLEPDAHRDDRNVLASSTAGPFTTASFVRWMGTFPPQQQMAQRIQTAPDSAVEDLIRHFVRNELLVRSADSAAITVAPTELERIRNLFASQIQQAWLRLGVHPERLADSATTPAAREEFAARRVSEYVEAVLADRAPYFPVGPEMQAVLRTRYPARVNAAGVDRALQVAQRTRGQAESARASAGAPSAVPVPDTGEAPGAPPPDTP